MTISKNNFGKIVADNYLVDDTQKFLHEEEAGLVGAPGPPHPDLYAGGPCEGVADKLHDPLQGPTQHPAAPLPLVQAHIRVKPTWNFINKNCPRKKLRTPKSKFKYQV
jgi:hypothetical protein